ncbi:unnamed protein product [Caenorhabditis bovis]|uniref:Lipase maturation factor n=1 Tax=Caenorhabditis bovis TaxID=2654633 RepID=A0A8S1EJG6_9PELO|nr:unnamed protein product [Caenorhabditis bovis]
MDVYNTDIVKKWVLVGHTFVLLAAFSSIFWQIPGLYGDHGLVPIAPKLNCDSPSPLQCRLPLLQIFSRKLSLSPVGALQFTAALGICICVLLAFIPKMRNLPMFMALFMLYSAINQGGDVFMGYQWDSLLLETTSYVAILAWFKDGPADSIPLYGLLTLGMRLIFSIGATKYQTSEADYFDFKAFNRQFETQPLPSTMSFLAHSLPSLSKMFLSVLSLSFELLAPPFMLIPLRPLRWGLFMCYLIAFVFMVIFGNYGFYPFNAIVLLIPLLEVRPQDPLFELISLGAVSVGLFLFLFDFIPSDNSGNFGVSLKSLNGFLDFYIPLILMAVFLLFLFTVITAVVRILQDDRSVSNFFHLLFSTFAIGTFVFYGMIQLSPLNKSFEFHLRPYSNIVKNARTMQEWNLANQYGHKRRHGKFDVRYEIIIEGTNSLNDTWKEIEFYAKPGNIFQFPPFLAFYHPRLDWQMSWAAQGTYQQNPFFMSLMYHLLENTPEVVNLLSNYPFKNKDKQMNFIRAHLFVYKFSTKKTNSAVWSRTYAETYMSEFNKENTALIAYLEQSRLLVKESPKPKRRYLERLMSHLQKWAMSYGQRDFCWILVMTAVVIVFWQNYYDGEE